MFRSIVSKLWVSIALLLVLILMTLGIVLSKQFETLFFQQQWGEMKSHGRELAKILAKSHDPDMIQREINFWGQISGFKISVVDVKGKVIYSSDVQHAVPGSLMKPPELAQTLNGREAVFNRYHKAFGQDMLSVLLPVAPGNKVTGAVMLHSPIKPVQDFLKRTYQTIFIIIIGAIILAVGLGLILARALAVPLLKMNGVAKQMAKGNFDLKVDVKSNDEIGLLGDTLNLLSTRLKATLQDLAGKNEELTRVLALQKEFLANVSHELRTPLFIIQGYTEAMVDGLATRGEIKEKSLRVMLDETHRLRRLVEDLLALSRTQKESRVNYKEVSLVPVMEKVIYKFRQLAQQQQVDLKLRVDGLLPLVLGDEDRLEQVLTNLVDNALRYSPAGSIIKISAGITPEGLLVAVADEGPGIPEDELPYIWERFYKVDKARSRKGSGTGLGLVIVKNIIKAHAGRIWVESKLGAGTVFKFIIPEAGK